ncbi:MAG: 30S ribosomal protein S11 [Candidatus Pacebacteria bacterium]|nr:30S ribosomal protein S11 [Candidatus Paceibacterota bacterium]
MKKKTEKTPAKKSAAKPARVVRKARVYIQSTFNNTIITFTDLEGKTLCWGSTGAAGFRGTRKHTPFAATTAMNAVAKKGKMLGIREMEIYIKGPGSGRDAALRALKAAGFKMDLIADVTPIPHNGPRPRKARRT